MVTLADTLRPLESSIVATTLAELAANKPQIIAEFGKLELNAIDALTDHIVGILPTHGLLSAVSGPLATAVKAHEGEIVAALGGPNEALYALLVHEVTQLGVDGLL